MSRLQRSPTRSSAASSAAALGRRPSVRPMVVSTSVERGPSGLASVVSSNLQVTSYLPQTLFPGFRNGQEHLSQMSALEELGTTVAGLAATPAPPSSASAATHAERARHRRRTGPHQRPQPAWREVTVTFADGRRPAASRGVDADGDLAVVSVDTTGAAPVEWGAGDELAVGTPVFAVAAPLGGGSARHVRARVGECAGVPRPGRPADQGQRRAHRAAGPWLVGQRARRRPGQLVGMNTTGSAKASTSPCRPTPASASASTPWAAASRRSNSASAWRSPRRMSRDGCADRSAARACRRPGPRRRGRCPADAAGDRGG